MTRTVAAALSLMASVLLWPHDQGPRARTSLPTIEIDSGPLDRTNAIINFTLPVGARGEPLQLRDASSNTTFPLQITRDRTAWFAVDHLARGERRQLVIEPALDRRDPIWPATARVETMDVMLKLQQQPVLQYQMEKSSPPRPDIKPIFQRGGYIPAVYTSSGRLVTDDYPPNHLHHHGIWSGWAKTEFQGRSPDFWNTSNGTGAVEFEALLDSWSGPVHTGFRARHRMVDLTSPVPTTAVLETWEVTLFHISRQPGRAFRMFDLTSIQEAATPDPVALLKAQDGGLSVHGYREWNGPNGALRVLTSEGNTHTNGDGTRTRWCYIGGIVDGAPSGLVILGAPLNFRAPLSLRLHATEPFFSFTPTPLGRIDIRPGQPLVTRYRFLVFDGQPDAAWIEQRWQEFANPVRVRT